MLDNWQRGLVLHKKPYGETSLLIEMFTENFGKISLIAKGARNKNSKLKGILQLFTPIIVRWIGTGSLKTLTHAEILALTIPLRSNLLYSGFYINELLKRLLEHETAYTKLFLEYLNCLSNLAQYPKQEQIILRTFELKLLSELGFAINFQTCINGEKIRANLHYIYILNQGFMLASDVDMPAFSGKVLQACGEYLFNTDEILRSAKKITRYTLNNLLGNQPLKSRELYSFRHTEKC